jgi:hypothetical protein
LLLLLLLTARKAGDLRELRAKLLKRLRQHLRRHRRHLHHWLAGLGIKRRRLDAHLRHALLPSVGEVLTHNRHKLRADALCNHRIAPEIRVLEECRVVLKVKRVRLVGNHTNGLAHHNRLNFARWIVRQRLRFFLQKLVNVRHFNRFKRPAMGCAAVVQVRVLRCQFERHLRHADALRIRKDVRVSNRDDGNASVEVCRHHRAFVTANIVGVALI